MNEIFAHTISRIDFVEGMVRIELASLVPAAGDTTAVEPRHILHMPLGGFMRGAVTLEGFIREMVKRGILAPPPPPAPLPASGSAEAGAPASPNFP